MDILNTIRESFKDDNIHRLFKRDPVLSNLYHLLEDSKTEDEQVALLLDALIVTTQMREEASSRVLSYTLRFGSLEDIKKRDF